MWTRTVPRSSARLVAILATLALVSVPVIAQPVRAEGSDTVHMSLADARIAALRGNPVLKATRLEIDVARGELRQAGVILRSNPEADILGGSDGAEIGVTQEIEIAGQRGARVAAARASLDRATAVVADEVRTTLGDVDRTFYRFVAADRRMTLASEVLELNRRLADLSQKQLSAGEISGLDFNLAVVEFGRSRARLAFALRERSEEMQQLLQLLGLDPQTVIVPVLAGVASVVPASDSAARSAVQTLGAVDSAWTDQLGPLESPSSVDSLVGIALSRRPDLVASEAAVREAAAQVSLARREAFPNLLLRAVSEPSSERTEARELRPGLGLTIPMFNLNRGEIQARRAAARQMELLRSSVVARARAEVSRAVASYRTASTEKAVLEATVLSPARENRRLLEIAFREGKVGLPVLLLIRNQVIDAELEYWEAWLAEREALADLTEATGDLLVGLKPGAIP